MAVPRRKGIRRFVRWALPVALTAVIAYMAWRQAELSEQTVHHEQRQATPTVKVIPSSTSYPSKHREEDGLVQTDLLWGYTCINQSPFNVTVIDTFVQLSRMGDETGPATQWSRPTRVAVNGQLDRHVPALPQRLAQGEWIQVLFVDPPGAEIDGGPRRVKPVCKDSFDVEHASDGWISWERLPHIDVFAAELPSPGEEPVRSLVAWEQFPSHRIEWPAGEPTTSSIRRTAPPH